MYIQFCRVELKITFISSPIYGDMWAPQSYNGINILTLRVVCV